MAYGDDTACLQSRQYLLPTLTYVGANLNLKSGIDKNNKILNFSFTFFILKLLSTLSLTDNYSCVSLPLIILLSL